MSSIHHLSRRSILATVAATAAMPGFTAEPPDADVFDLIARYEEADARDVAALDAVAAIEGSMGEWEVLNPEPEIERELQMPESLQQAIMDWSRQSRAKDAAAKDDTTYLAWVERKAAAEAERGLTEAEERLEVVRSEWADARDNLVATTAITLAGIRAKARVALASAHADLAWSIVQDLVDLDKNA